MKKALLALALLFIGLSAWCGWEAFSFLHYPPAKIGQEVVFDVPQGATLSGISKELVSKQLITNARKFIWYARYKDMDHKLQSGRFVLNTGWTPGHILDALVNGQPILYKVTIPEGLTWWQTGRLLENEGFVKFDDFKKIISDKDFLRHHGIPFDNAEGFLMPDTYLFKKPDAASLSSPEKETEFWQKQTRNIASRMIDNFWRKTNNLWPRSADSKEDANGIYRPNPETIRQAVIIASIVEKETGVPQERARVAGVYTNRLAKNMKLQADPTVIYGVGPEFGGAIKRAHLDDAANKYNTYQHPGLPPGPICSFGAAAFKAALNPEKHNYLYFVAKGDSLGAHTFSQTWEEHSKAVDEYRRQKKNR